MLVLNPKPHKTTDAKKLRDWLNQPESRLLLDYLSRKDGEHTALAGNLLVGADAVSNAADPSQNCAEAIVEANKAKFFREVIELLEEIRNPEKSLETVTIEHKMTSNTQ